MWSHGLQKQRGPLSLEVKTVVLWCKNGSITDICGLNARKMFFGQIEYRACFISAFSYLLFTLIQQWISNKLFKKWSFLTCLAPIKTHTSHKASLVTLSSTTCRRVCWGLRWTVWCRSVWASWEWTSTSALRRWWGTSQIVSSSSHNMATSHSPPTTAHRSV